MVYFVGRHRNQWKEGMGHGVQQILEAVDLHCVPIYPVPSCNRSHGMCYERVIALL